MIPRPILIAAAVALLAAPALGQTTPEPGPKGFSATGQPTDFEVTGKTYAVNGYRSARWDMTPAEARAAATKDFPDAEIGKDVVDPVARTTLFVVAVPHISPGPGTAAVSYIFGANSGRLIHVNVDWQIDDANVNDRVAMTVAGSRVVQDFIGYYWKLLSVARGVPIGPNSLLLFGGQGDAGGSVEVQLQGVSYTTQTAKGAVQSPPPTGFVLLHVGFAPSGGDADVYKIKPGEF
jgi:hypothetical protein